MNALRAVTGVILLFFGATFLNVGVIVLVTGDVPTGLIALALGALLTGGGVRLSPRWRLALAVICWLHGVGVLGVLRFEENRGQVVLVVALAALYAIVGALLLRWHTRTSRPSAGGRAGPAARRPAC